VVAAVDSVDLEILILQGQARVKSEPDFKPTKKGVAV